MPKKPMGLDSSFESLREDIDMTNRSNNIESSAERVNQTGV